MKTMKVGTCAVVVAAITVLSGCQSRLQQGSVGEEPKLTTKTAINVPSEPITAPLKQVDAESFIRTSTENVKAFWDRNEINLNEVSDSGVMGVIKCKGKFAPSERAMYCTTDDVLYYVTPKLNILLAQPHGDTATTIIVAHEMGHAIQDMYADGAFDGAKGDRPIDGVPVAELSADCFAGMYMASTGDAETEIRDGVGLTALHKNRARVAAFRSGMATAPSDVKTCFTNYE